MVMLLVSCDQSTLPTAPSEVTSGLTVYEHANYLGESALMTRSIADLSDYEGPCQHTDSGPYGSTVTLDWDDCISSVRIAPGWQATIYRDSNYSGDSLNVTGDLSNLQLVRGRCDHDGMNDCITSIQVVRAELVPGSMGNPPALN
jgi:peptidase inhibitor family I36